MKQYFPSAGLEKLCGLFGKTRQAFYSHNWRSSDNDFQEALIIDLVKTIRVVLPKTGGLKLLYMLKDDFAMHKICIGRDSFFTLLRKHGLLIKRKRRYIKTTNSNHPYYKWPDLTKSFTLNASDQLWVSDITYIRTDAGFIYLFLITDSYSKKIVGHHLSQQLKAQGCLIALNKAISTLPAANKPIHHSDRGIQYCCEQYVSMLQTNGIRISMTQTGSPYDNPVAERVNGILKTELNLERTFSSYSSAIQGVHQAIDAYNRIRPHMSCGNLTPLKAHIETKPLVKTWKNKKYCKPKAVVL